MIHNIVHENISLEFILGILNSKLINIWFDRTFPEGLHIKINQLQQIPIVIPNKDELKCCEDLVEEILKLNKTLETKSSKYTNRVQSNLGLDKISNKLNQFYEYDFKTFLSELKKKKIKLSRSDQDEWEEYFNQHKVEINQLQLAIKNSMNEIDNLVFKLYNLNADKVNIIKEAYA